MEEIWKKFENFTKYEASNLGNIRHNVRKKPLKGNINSSGYKYCTIRHAGINKTIIFHRIIAECFVEKIDGKNYVNHINRIKTDNRAANLEYVTNKENCIHAYMGRKRGITIAKNGKYIAQINRKHIGRFIKKDDAYNAFFKEFIKIYGVEPW
jgi:hypothetical protein